MSGCDSTSIRPLSSRSIVTVGMPYHRGMPRVNKSRNAYTSGWYGGGTMPLVPAKGSIKVGWYHRTRSATRLLQLQRWCAVRFSLSTSPGWERRIIDWPVGRPACVLRGWSEESPDKRVKRAQNAGDEQRIQLPRLPSLRPWQRDEHRDHRQPGYGTSEVLSEDLR